ncbi:sulfatase [Niastella yeongjuensis]|uniref:Sulfatase n=1 Tax=Niastella yeongjuensis TaxID=354355 RepID=A0A1V9F804_9BACT|nr:LTA synthase family protein [Niastella yeongjuensis]OQP54488.1 sulfatase [Niastella yeongjuensis]SEN96668.1 Phosphoglycerol transferase MdoB [Niastella yeongjuensis]
MVSKSRYSVLFQFILFFLIISFITRTVLLAWSFQKADPGLLTCLRIYAQGLLFDTIVALCFSVVYAVYLLVLPQRWNTSYANKVITYAGFFLTVLIIMFSFFAEFAFWDEFESRFNFIAVDYLVYTFEVINNINQSYPLPWLIGGMLLLTALVLFIFYKRRAFQQSFKSDTSFATRLLFTATILTGALLGVLFIPNSWADGKHNRYQNELSKAGIYSFFSAFRNNELNYYDFYAKEPEATAFSIVRSDLQEADASFTGNGFTIRRQINNAGMAQKPNVILVTIESFSADFMGHFGNTQHLTPVLDALADSSILFTNMYSTGTRTVRGMEALTLCVPPTPGNSIVRRNDNQGLFTVGSIFKKAGYTRSFFYGGDGYFDNMNNFFGNNGFDITDKGGRFSPGDHFTGARNIIDDKNIHFANAWGICDEDLYDAVISEADARYAKQQPFFDFVMTTSNHRPFTYPDKKIDIPSGTGRDGAVKYTDYAIGEFLKKVRTKPWFNNTVIIFVADHCASSAGKNEINVSKYHIPCIISNLKSNTPPVIDQQCSQIDLFATLFGLLNWQYESDWYGKNVLLPTFQPRAYVATYQKLGYLQRDSLVIASPQQQITTTKWNAKTDEQRPIKNDPALSNKAIAAYQSAYYLFKNGGMKE